VETASAPCLVTAPGAYNFLARPAWVPRSAAAPWWPASPLAPFTVTITGAASFIATYSGDAFYAAIATPGVVGCGVLAETFAVALRPIGLITSASTTSATVASGTALTDTAFFTPPAGGPSPPVR
jgi:hypothetical protein